MKCLTCNRQMRKVDEKEFDCKTIDYKDEETRDIKEVFSCDICGVYIVVTEDMQFFRIAFKEILRV